jgi:hypothetical protein
LRYPVSRVARKPTGDVRVLLRDSQSRVAKDLLNNADIDALFEQKGGSRVPGIMQASLTHPGLYAKALPFHPVIPSLQRVAAVVWDT